MIRFADGDQRIIFRGNHPDSSLIARGAATTSGRVVEIIKPKEPKKEEHDVSKKDKPRV